MTYQLHPTEILDIYRARELPDIVKRVPEINNGILLTQELYTCRFCRRQLPTIKGRRLHEGRMHNE